MNANTKLHWLDPRKTIWGFHCHQELPLEHFSNALSVNEQCEDFLVRNGMLTTNDSFRPGYGLHADWMWEIRVERGDPDALEQMGIAAVFLAVNRSGLNAFIHPLMHDKDKDDESKNRRINEPTKHTFVWKPRAAKSGFLFQSSAR